jgi:hypothetical protein
MRNELDDDLLEQQLLNDIYEFDCQQQLQQLTDNDINFNLVPSGPSSDSERSIINLDEITKSSCDDSSLVQANQEEESVVVEENSEMERISVQEDAEASEDEEDWENNLIYVPAGK